MTFANISEMREQIRLKLAAEKLLKEVAFRNGCVLEWAGNTAWVVRKGEDPRNSFHAELVGKMLTFYRPGKAPTEIDVTADHSIKTEPRGVELSLDAEPTAVVTELIPAADAEAATAAQPEIAPPSLKPDFELDVDVVTGADGPA